MLHQVSGSTIDGASYTYDAAGNRTSKTNYLTGTTENYGYDPLYELTQVTQGGSTTESYSYDPAGNRLSSLTVPLYNYNSSNQLTSSSAGNYTYDANGNTLSDAQGRSFTWDFENRLVQATNPGVGTTTFKYDPFGRRTQKSGPLGTTTFLYDGIDASSNIIEEVDASGNVLAKYAQGDLIDEPLSMLRSGAISYYERDGLGSITSLSNAAAALTNTYTYDSFGKLIASMGGVTNPFQYAGREFDPETGLYLNRARYYDEGVGRFVSEDPARFRGGSDFYRYTHNDPINRTDPDGLGAAECTKALLQWALAYSAVQRRLDAFVMTGDMDPGHEQALEEALNHLKNAQDEVARKCNCDIYKAEVAAVIGATAALAQRVADAIRQLCQEDPEVCYAW